MPGLIRASIYDYPAFSSILLLHQNLNPMGKNYTFLLLLLCLSLSAPVLAQTPEAFKFTGSNYIVGQDPIDASGEFTVEFWAYVNFDGQAHQLIAEGAPSTTFYVGYGADGLIYVGDAWGNTNVQMPFGTWTHFAVTFDDNSFQTTLFLNGVQVAATSNFYFQDGAPLAIGTSADLTAPLVTGDIQDVAVYDAPRPASQIKADMFNTSLSDPSLTLFYSMNDPSGTTITNTAASGNSQNGTLYGDDGTNSYVASPVQFSSNGLTFDGNNAKVTVPSVSAYDLSAATGGTIELWVNPATPPSGLATLVGNGVPGDVRFSIQLSSTQVGLDMGSGVNAIDLPDTFTTSNVWHHFAFVNTGTTTRVYINGNILDSIPGSFGTGSNENLVFGQPVTSSGSAFNGSLDEIRIWNTQRTQPQIQGNMGNTLSGIQTGLVGEFGFDEGIPGGNNTGLTTTLDNSSIGNSGSLQFFALAGTAANFTAHTLSSMPLPLTLTRFTANRDNDESVLQWETASEQNTLDFVVERSPDGQTYTSIGTVDAAGNSTTTKDYAFDDRTPQPNANYYRLKQTDIDGKFTYSPVCVVNFPISGKLIWYSTGTHSVEVALSQGNNEFYSLADASGRLIRLGQLSGGKTQFADLPAGMYFVRIVTNTGPLVTKIVL